MTREATTSARHWSARNSGSLAEIAVCATQQQLWASADTGEPWPWQGHRRVAILDYLVPGRIRSHGPA